MAATVMETTGFRPAPAGGTVAPSRWHEKLGTDVLPMLAFRCAAALRAFGASLSALDQVLQSLAQVEPQGSQAADARATVHEVVGLLQREGPALLLHAQALRLRLHAAGMAGPDGLAPGLRALQTQISRLDALAAPWKAPDSEFGVALCASREVARELANGFEHMAAQAAG